MGAAYSIDDKTVVRAAFSRTSFQEGTGEYNRLATNAPLIGAFAWYGLTALFWFYILTRVPLSLAYAFSIVGSGLVPLVAWLVFKEPLDWRFPLGYLLMLTGFAVIMTGQRAVVG